MSDRVIANLLYRSKDERPEDPRPHRQPGADRGRRCIRVPVDVQIPIDSLTLLPQGENGDHVGGFDVYVAVANKDNDMSDVARKSHQVRIPAADIERAKGKYYTYTLELLMEKGLNKISIGVVDGVSFSNGFAREQIIAQDLR